MDLKKVRSAKLDIPRHVRLGRGTSSGLGKTSGRGQKGAGARSGISYIVYFEGGQMPLARKLPKRGFTNRRFRLVFGTVDLDTLEKNFAAGDEVNIEVLKQRRLIPKKVDALRILGSGSLTRKLTVKAEGFTATAKEKIEKAGGSTEVVLPISRRQRTVNIRASALNKFNDGDVVDPSALSSAGLLKEADRPVKIVQGGILQRKLTVKVHRFSRRAVDVIRRAGGEVVQLT